MKCLVDMMTELDLLVYREETAIVVSVSVNIDNGQYRLSPSKRILIVSHYTVWIQCLFAQRSELSRSGKEEALTAKREQESRSWLQK